jgi:hypothetical protein
MIYCKCNFLLSDNTLAPLRDVNWISSLQHFYLFLQIQLSDVSYVYLEVICQCGTLYIESAGMNVKKQEEMPACYIGTESLNYLYVTCNVTTSAWFYSSLLP